MQQAAQEGPGSIGALPAKGGKSCSWQRSRFYNQGEVGTIASAAEDNAKAQVASEAPKSQHCFPQPVVNWGNSLTSVCVSLHLTCKTGMAHALSSA